MKTSQFGRPIIFNSQTNTLAMIQIAQRNVDVQCGWADVEKKHSKKDSNLTRNRTTKHHLTKKKRFEVRHHGTNLPLSTWAFHLGY